MKKYALLISVWLSCAALILGGCGTGTAQPAVETPAAEPTLEPTRAPTPLPTQTPFVVKGTLRLWHSFPEAQRPALLRRIDAFQKLYPDVQFDVLYVPSVDLRASYEAAATEGDPPQILIGPAEWGPGLFRAGRLQDLSGRLRPDLLKFINPAALGPAAALGSGQVQNTLIGLPLDVQGVVLYRNTSLLPRPPMTFDELAAQAKAITKGERIGAILDRSFFYSGAHLYGLGGSLMDPAGRPAFTNEKGLEWVKLLQSFDRAGPADFGSDKDLEAFKEGRVGWIIDGTWNRGALQEALGEGVLAIDPWPVANQGQLSGFVQAENLYLSAPGAAGAPGDDPELAWKFAEFLLSPESQAALLEVGLIPAMLPDNLPAVKADALTRQAMQALAGGTAYPNLPDMAFYTTALDAALSSVLDGKEQPAAALQKAAESIQAAEAGALPPPTPTP